MLESKNHFVIGLTKFGLTKFSKQTMALISVSSLAVSLVSCTSSTPSTSSSGSAFQVTQSVSPIFSTRPEATSHSYFILKLKSPPLFSSIDRSSGAGVVNAAALKALDEEQGELLKNLQTLSTDIKVIYRYRIILNAIAIVAPTALIEKIGAFAGVSHIESGGRFDRPVLPTEDAPLNTKLIKTLQARNSVKFIGGDVAHSRGVRGQGLKVGVIDTGIDYTHAMFGGAATEAAYKAIDPSQPTTSFPNGKVTGGFDFVGTNFNTSSPIFADTIPRADVNPIDEAGHGTHVAGTVAGLGDGVETYDGVAPDAELYALKVFGANGSTSDTAVIAALEYSADPNADGDLSDQLDVVNLSLGSGFGSGHILYSEAIQNLTLSGTVVVASGGNSGDVPYIVGSPGASDDALSVAASVDDMDQNWRFKAAKFSTVDNPSILVEAIEGTVGKPLAESGLVKASIVPGGIADKDFSPEQAALLMGKIALLDRGVVGFADKVKRAQIAGSIGVVMVNNQPGPPISMGGADTPFDIPAIMITKELGDTLKEALTRGDVVAELTTPDVIERPELIDTMALFSSRGPRSIDALMKPEISAPGNLIVSADMGKGTKSVQLSGTSMAAPHMAGVMALLKQAHPTLTPIELKALAMSTSKTMVDETGKMYPIARQGAGRVQILKALDAKVLPLPSSISLGEVTVEARKTMQRTVGIKNISAAPLELSVSLGGATKGFSLVNAPKVKLAAGSAQPLDLRFVIDLAAMNSALSANSSNEISGYVLLSDASGEVARIPVLAIANKVSRIEASKLIVRSTSNTDSQGAAVDVTLTNRSANVGDAYPFNLIGRGAKKPDPTMDPFRSKICDLAESGYRVIQKDGVPTLQIAAKLFEPMTTWHLCEVSVLIDSDGDFSADQELAGVVQASVPGLPPGPFVSLLIDAKIAQQIRRDYDAAVLVPPTEPAPGETPKAPPVLDFLPSIVALSPMLAFEHSTIALLEVPVSDLKLKLSGALAVRVATSQQTGSAIEPDDFLSKDPKKWTPLNVSSQGAGYTNLPEKITMNPGETKVVTFTKGAGKESLLMIYPSGKPLTGGLDRDLQSQVLRPTFNGN